jgi:hypothetical protein
MGPHSVTETLQRAMVVAGVLCLAAARATPQPKPPPAPKTRQVFVSVQSSAGTPVLDLSTGDFDVEEGGATRRVVHAGLATEPMRILLLVDTSDAASPALNHMRLGLVALLDTLPPDAEVALISTGRQVRVRVSPTTDRKKLKDAASGLFPDGAGTVLMDGLMEMDDRFLKKTTDRWPVFVIVTTDGTESSGSAHEKQFNTWLNAMPLRVMSAHAVVLKVKDSSGVPEMMAMNAARATSGRYESIVISSALPDKMKAVGAQLAADFLAMATKYQVDFATETAGPLTGVNIGVHRDGVKMQLSYARK